MKRLTNFFLLLIPIITIPYTVVCVTAESNMDAAVAQHLPYGLPAMRIFCAAWDLADFIVSVDEIEALTGMDFLSRVDDDVESKIESKRADGPW